MPNPYFQVARTYLQQPFCSLQRFLAIVFFFACGFSFSGVIEKHKYVSSQAFLFIALFSYWAIHVKEQFADARTSLTPGFRKVHGVVATMVAFILCILLPGTIALLVGWQPLGLISITTFLFGIILWAVLRLGNSFIFLMAAGWILTQFEPTQNVVEKIVSGNEPVQAFTFLGVGAVLGITGIIRLFLLNEENPDYHLNPKFPIDGRTGLSDLQWQKLKKSYSRGWRRRSANRTTARMIYHARHATYSYWSRMQRWNYSNRSVWIALFYATLAYLFFTSKWLFGEMSADLGARNYMATFMPVFLLNTQFRAKSRFMAHDCMMPVGRDAYLKQVGMSFAASQLILWGVFLTVSVLWIFIESAKPTTEYLIISILYSLMIQIWIFGLGIWISSFRSAIMNVLFVIAAIASAFPITRFDAQMMLSWQPLIWGTLLACLGLLLTWWGYRRWLVADFV